MLPFTQDIIPPNVIQIIDAHFHLHKCTFKMSFNNKAAWLPEQGAQLKVDAADTWKPASGELLIKNHAIAINPADWKMQSMGLFIESYPTILGNDVAGEVAAVGEGVTGFKVGQRVLAHALGLHTKKPSDASFQNYTIVAAAAAAEIPDDVSFEAASVLPLSLSTAAQGLYGKEFLQLPLPSHSPKKTGKTLLVWGGSSSVGASAVQLATASGLEVVATASKKNFDFVKGLGAVEVLDYSSPSVVGDLVAYLKDKEVVGAYDVIAERDSGMQVAQVLAQLGGGFFASSLPAPEDIPATVSGKMVYAPSIFLFEPQIGRAVYGDFLPKALESGQLKPAPPAKVVAKGLEGIQQGLDIMRKGASATKYVVTL